MRFRVSLSLVLFVFSSLSGYAATKKQPLELEVSASADGLPLVTLTSSDTPLSEVAERLAKELGTTIRVSATARSFRVTTDVAEQPLDLTLRQLAPQAFVDGIFTGGAGKYVILVIHLLMAGESTPPMPELTKRSSETLMFYGHTEDPSIDPLEDKLDVTYRNDRLRVFGKGQPLSVVVARIAEELRIPFQLIGESREVVDVAMTDATLQQVMRALPPSVKLYHRKNLATFALTPVRIVLEENALAATPPVTD